MTTDWFYVGQDIQIQTKDNNFTVSEFFDSLNDLVTVDEINPNSGEHWLASDNFIFTFTNSDFEMLQKRGICRIYSIGSIKDNVDLGNENDLEFCKWYFGVNTLKGVRGCLK